MLIFKKAIALFSVTSFLFMVIFVMQEYYDQTAHGDYAFKVFALFVLLVLNSITWEFLKVLYESSAVDWNVASFWTICAGISFALMFVVFRFAIPVNGQLGVLSITAFVLFAFCFAISGLYFVISVGAKTSTK